MEDWSGVAGLKTEILPLSTMFSSDQPCGLVVSVYDYWLWGPGLDSRFYHGYFSLNVEDSHGDHGLSSLVELKFKVPPGASYSYITIHLIGTT
jgi:hypothetical protein